MAIKITGAVLIIITSCIIGYLLSIKEDLRCRDLSEIEKILQNIFSQIDYKKEVLTVAIDNSIEDSNVYIKNIFEQISTAIKNNTSVPTAWRISFENNYQFTDISKEDATKISALGEILTSGDIDFQEKGFKGAITYIHNTIQSSKEKSIKDKKIYRCLCSSLGLLIVVLLF